MYSRIENRKIRSGSVYKRNYGVLVDSAVGVSSIENGLRIE